MFIGHFALAYAARRAEPRLSLGTAFLAAQLPDAIWPALLLAGAEQVTIAPGDTVVTPLRFDSYPWSHSLVLDAGWGAAFAAILWALGRGRRAALLAGLLVVSHWVLDFVTHRPDMPLWPGGARYGLGLWNHRNATLLVEICLYAICTSAYLSRAEHRARAIGLALTLLAIYLGNVFGPPPPSTAAIAAAGLIGTAVAWMWAEWSDGRLGRQSRA